MCEIHKRQTKRERKKTRKSLMNAHNSEYNHKVANQSQLLNKSVIKKYRFYVVLRLELSNAFFFLPIVQYSEQDIRSRKLYLFLLSGEKVSEHPLNWVHQKEHLPIREQEQTQSPKCCILFGILEDGQIPLILIRKLLH